jgi:activator of the mannose operon, transcriptional antiterminator
MKNIRRKSLLKRLLQSGKGKYISVDVLARELAASEKTIRTDLKALDSLLVAYPETRIIRKPGFGVCLEATEAERLALSEWNKGEKSLSQVSRETLGKQMLLELLLQRESVMTMQKLADRLYVSKPTIRHELKEISDWLKDFHLKLVIKPNVGLQIEGKEQDWRVALLELLLELAQYEEMPDEVFTDSRIQGPVQGSAIYPAASLMGGPAQDSTKGHVIDGLVNHQELMLLRSWIRNLQRDVEVDFTDIAASNLVVYLAVMIKRFKDKKIIQLSNEETQMIREKPEFKWAEILADRIRQSFAIELPESEIVYLGLHFMGAKRQTLIENDPEAFTLSIQLVREMEHLVLQPFSKDRELVTGIAIHLHSALSRIRFGLRIKNPLLSQIKEMYRYPFEALLLAAQKIAVPVGIAFSEDEVGYLTLHFQAALERLHRNTLKSVRALLVCSAGTGTSRLLSSRIARIFPEIHVVHVTSMFRLENGIKAYKPDIIIGTVPLAHPSIPSVTVSALFPESDRLKVEAFITELSKMKNQYATIGQMVIPELVFLDLDFRDRFHVMAFLAERLTESGYTEIGYDESVLSREQISSTAIGGGIAIPHGESRYIRKSGIAIARLKQPLDWGDEKIKHVFMLAITLDNRSQTEQLFHEMANLVDDEIVLSRLDTVSAASGLISCLTGRKEEFPE